EMLNDLKFTDNDFERNISTLSGGEAVRVSLFLTLISGNNVLILDEPTNYLDIDTINVLETYLNTYSCTVLLTSHDAEFLENVADEVYNIEYRNLKKIILVVTLCFTSYFHTFVNVLILQHYSTYR